MEVYNQFIAHKYDNDAFSNISAIKKQNGINKEKLEAERDNQLCLLKSLENEMNLYKYGNDIFFEKSQRTSRKNWISGIWPIGIYASVNFLLAKQNLYKSMTSKLGSSILLGSFALNTLIHQTHKFSPYISADEIFLTKALNQHLMNNIYKRIRFGKNN